MDINISETIDKLKNEKQIIAKKVLELSNAVKNSFAKIEKKYEEKFSALENKLEMFEKQIIQKIDSKVHESEAQMREIGLVEEKHSDDVLKLEQQYSHTNELLKVIDNRLVDLESKILESNNIIEKLEEEKAKQEVKQCIFDRTGFCRENKQCMFFHSEEVCEIFLDAGICWKQNCIKRHPKTCRYFQRGFCRRGEECVYLRKSINPERPVHSVNRCDRCGIYSNQMYFCEFCSKNFCQNCTAKEAHHKNIYNMDLETPNCSAIHHQGVVLL